MDLPKFHKEYLEYINTLPKNNKGVPVGAKTYAEFSRAMSKKNYENRRKEQRRKASEEKKVAFDKSGAGTESKSEHIICFSKEAYRRFRDALIESKRNERNLLDKNEDLKNRLDSYIRLKKIQTSIMFDLRNENTKLEKLNSLKDKEIEVLNKNIRLSGKLASLFFGSTLIFLLAFIGILIAGSKATDKFEAQNSMESYYMTGSKCDGIPSLSTNGETICLGE